MANENVTSRASSCKEKSNNPTKCCLKIDQNGKWSISKNLVHTHCPIHNHFVGSAIGDTLENVGNGIATLATFLSLDERDVVLPKKSADGIYWLARNMIEALKFEASYRDELTE